jgi:hypothetical protein
MKKKLLYFCTAICSVVLLASCSKDETEANASIMFVNASPNGASLDAAVGGSVVASGIAYPNNSGYKTVATGTQNIRVTQSTGGAEVLNGSFNIESGAYYSFYVIDSSHERKAAVIRDDLSAPSAGKAKIRVLHFAPDAPAVNISITGSGTSAINMNNRSFNDVSTTASHASFIEVDAAGLTVQANSVATTTNVFTLPVPALTAGKIYTIIIRGFPTGTGSQGLGLQVIQHN